jgi:hypothetical protein
MAKEAGAYWRRGRMVFALYYSALSKQFFSQLQARV